MPRRVLLALLAAALVAIAAWLASPYFTATAFVLDLAGSQLWIRRALPVRVRTVEARDLEAPSRYGPVPARLYEPAGRVDRSVVLFPGVHAGGVDEPRLDTFARRIAASGAIVLSVPLPELRRYRVTAASTDVIEDVARWAADSPAVAPRGHITLTGVSFAGGLAIVAAGRPGLERQIDAVVALGAQADVPEVMTYLCSGQLPGGGSRRPHDFGVAVILLAALPRLLPADQVDEARAAVLAFLDAASYETMAPAQAAAILAEARRLTAQAAEPARTLLEHLDHRDVEALGARLLPYAEELGGAPALSPVRSPAPHVPVFLLHGEEDNLIPSFETTRLAAYLRSHGTPRVRWLLTPLLSHADVQTPSLGEAWRLIAFWTEVLEASRHPR